MAVRTADASLDPAPSLDRAGRATVAVASAVSNGATAVGVPVAATGRVPAAIGVDRRIPVMAVFFIVAVLLVPVFWPF